MTRLAPSPTGALHLGNARTFLINWALARREGWKVVLRIEDFDTPRVKAETVRGVPETLSWLGMDWDEGPVIQSAEIGAHEGAMERLRAAGVVYPCELSRTQIEAAASASAPQEGDHETRFGPELRPAGFEVGRAWAGWSRERNWRFATEPGRVEFVDAFAGARAPEPARTIGDFLVWTKRGVPAYQLAVVVDDHRQGVTDVVRGDDLVDSAARQLLLYRALGWEDEPRYWHLPLVVGEDGRRLAKRHGDTRLDAYRARGVPAEAVIGLCAHWCGVIPQRGVLSAREFLDGLRVDRIAKEPITFTAEDDAWLMSAAR